MARKDDGEKVKVNLIDMKKLITIMKRFCGSKATDEEITKWFYCKDGLHYMATNLGSSVDILFTNNFAGTYNPLGESYFTKPVKDAEKVDAIPLMVEVKDGKKKKLMDTGRKLDFPDVNGIFDKFNYLVYSFFKVKFNWIKFTVIVVFYLIIICFCCFG